MRIALFSDNTIGVNLSLVASSLSSRRNGVEFVASDSRYRVCHEPIVFEREEGLLNQLSSKIDAEVSFFLTSIPYENNFFYIGVDDKFLISLHGWHQLTDIPITNGISYLITSIMLKYVLEIGDNHDGNTGCINDFMWDKSIIDAGMRAAFICDKCRSSTRAEKLEDLRFIHFSSVLDKISFSSRKGKDVLENADALHVVSDAEPFDVFLCHNSKDKPEVRTLKARLNESGVTTWFDEDQLLPGQVWQNVLESQIESIKSCAVIVGPNGEGPWQEVERRAFINEFANRGCLIIPIIIGESPDIPSLPLFLKQFMWCDLRSNDEEQFARLVRAIEVGRQ